MFEMQTLTDWENTVWLSLIVQSTGIPSCFLNLHFSFKHGLYILAAFSSLVSLAAVTNDIQISGLQT